MKLAADGTRFAPGQPIVTPNIIKADQIAEYQTLVFNGYAQDAEAFAKNIIVEQNASNPNRVDVLWPGTLINQLRILRCLTSSACRLNQQEHKSWLILLTALPVLPMSPLTVCRSWWKARSNTSPQR
jgi:hypothetical protein